MRFLRPLLVSLPFASANPILLPRDATPGCTNTSFHDFKWTVQNFDFHASYIFTTPAHQNSWGYVNFTLFNPAIQSSTQCTAASDQLSDFFYGTVPYQCTSAGGVTPPAGASAKFDFSRPTNQLRFNQTWTCNDTDPQYPITFWGYAAVNLTLACTDTTWTNPNWTTPGTIYSDREIRCNPATVDVAPYSIAAAS